MTVRVSVREAAGLPSGWKKEKRSDIPLLYRYTREIGDRVASIEMSMRVSGFRLTKGQKTYTVKSRPDLHKGEWEDIRTYRTRADAMNDVQARMQKFDAGAE